MSARIQEILKAIPKVDRLLAWPEMAPLLAAHPRAEVIAAVRLALAELREEVRSGRAGAPDDRSALIASIESGLARRSTHSLRSVINGTGVVVHTNLGRAPLAVQAEKAMLEISGGYCNLEYDLQDGARGKRNAHVEGLICELTGAEAALVVNNNAAAVILALSTLAIGREVVLSRGELVEIGGSFRIPDVMRQSGAALVEVGTTNRTHLRDFQAAASEATALFLKVHTSNFAVVGFTADTSIEELAVLGREKGIPVMLDAGSGCLVDLAPYGIAGEPTIARYLETGADVVTFSGDKLLGGPQAGIIAGKRSLVEPMKRHPLLRAIRMDKLSLAALEATLRLYRDEQRALREIPTLRMLTMPAGELSARATQIIRRLRRGLPPVVELRKQQGESSAGGGSFPLLQLPTTLIEVQIASAAPQRIEAALRRAGTPVIGRIHRDRFLLDVRTILDRDIVSLGASLAEAADFLTQEKR
ncbi:L-seryl-tRNA(Sec) selenium transferase [Geobacter sp. SVR]|uniref:L-seryl-tRNA(Sec) selenium transferase n=1 Tax=Geobacter sp. SVR TaxID=2495594 RepID=UPI00143EFBE4|nr:L-seryl-tRNA(Sec) selenium transferase [Geobacter sp. SVR]BCS52470.1 L-seryl-tRNA(Sec) selenium transferase [Geobacter sp. SVR]GCF84093.1 L-seryl-tRNA(Sec) selenium transferase [Geobacter sp. SVR]